jgi:hypothetical protein
LQWICIKSEKEPFGVKLFFENDFILSFPNAGGNTVRTGRFSLNGNLQVFESLGDIGILPDTYSVKRKFDYQWFWQNFGLTLKKLQL